ncbi:MAG: DUF6657 family protein [Treponemataceae bacterium]
MAHIKSALEIALERTESVKSDKAGVEQFELRREGKKIAGTFLEAPEEKPIEAALKRFPKDKLNAVRRGVLDILITQISLPSGRDELVRLETVGKGLHTIIGDIKFATIFQQLVQALDRYLSEVDQYDKAIRQQYAPKLRQKEDEVARRTGRRVQIDPMQDPEFVQFYNQNMGTLKDRYQTAVEQVRAQALALFEG